LHKVRRRKQEDALSILRATELFWGEYPNTAIPLGRESIQRVVGFIENTKPDFIFVHFGDDTRQDHRHLSTATVTATRYTRNVLFYEGPTAQNFSPNVFAY
jgi:LmbE family N-acetylglucosaminyl deacetylase